MNPLRVSASLPIRASVGVFRERGLAAPATTMGSPRDSQSGRKPPMNNSRRRALRAVLSALAGGGLTAASLSGPLAPGAIAAVMPAGATGAAEASSAARPRTDRGSPADDRGAAVERLLHDANHDRAGAVAVAAVPSGATGAPTHRPADHRPADRGTAERHATARRDRAAA